VQDIAERDDVLTRNGLADATWVETGTYLGDTTEFLSHTARMVYSIEPGPKLFAAAVVRFASFANVQILCGLSEDVLPELLPKITGDVCFWLDGHYTDETTHKGPQDTPIVDELNCIGDNIACFDRAVVLIDDIHLFNGQTHIYGPYPSIDKLQEWALAAKLNWHIEHDIFIAKGGKPP
jgi:hypothetical protein